MEIDEKLIKKVAALAKIELNEEEIKEFIPQFKDILTYFSKLDEIEVDSVEPSFHPIELKNVVREDKVEKSLSVEEAFKNTIHKKDGFFKGPRVI